MASGCMKAGQKMLKNFLQALSSMMETDKVYGKWNLD